MQCYFKHQIDKERKLFWTSKSGLKIDWSQPSARDIVLNVLKQMLKKTVDTRETQNIYFIIYSTNQCICHLKSIFFYV